MNLLIRDEQLNGKITNEFEIEIENEITSAREIIEKRVIHEVDNYNKKLPEYFHGLVEPTEAEKTLNGYKLKKLQLIDPEKQVYVALNSFMKNGFFIIVDNYQVEDINQEIKVTVNSKVSFLKLTPLIGG